MKIIIGLLIYCVVSVCGIAAAEEDWQAWVHQKTKEIELNKNLEFRSHCTALKTDIHFTLKKVAKELLDCEVLTAIDGSITAINKYWTDGCSALNTNDDRISMWDTMQDLRTLKKYVKEKCK